MASWLSGWAYRKAHAINPAIGAGTGYQIRIKVNYGSGTDSGENVFLNGKCRTDFGDIRFTRSDGVSLLNYWIEEKIDFSYAIFWVKIEDDLSTNPVTIYIYYGNPSATSISNGNAVFLFFDDFDDGVFDKNKWSIKAGTLGTDIVEANGVLEVRYQSTRGEVASVQSFLYNYRRVNRALVTSTSSPHECSQQNFQSPIDAIQWYGADALLTWNEGSYTRTDLSLTTANTWNKYEVDWVQGKVVFKFNDVVKATHTSNIPDEPLYLDLVAPTTSGGKVVYDWVFVAKYVDPEPSHGIWGSEEVPPPPPPAPAWIGTIDELKKRLIFTTTPSFLQLSGSGSVNILSPSDSSKTLTVRNWWLITNATDGRITLASPSKLFGSLLAKKQKKTGQEDIWTTLGMGEPILLYYQNITPDSKVLVLVSWRED